MIYFHPKNNDTYRQVPSLDMKDVEGMVVVGGVPAKKISKNGEN